MKKTKNEGLSGMAEKYTEAQKRASQKYFEKLDRIEIKLPKGSKEEIKSHADKTGESVTGFISRAISETIINDEKVRKNPT